MKKLILTFFCVVNFACSRTSNEKTINVSNVKMSGKDKGYFEVVDGSYVVKVVDDKIVIPVKFRLLKKYNQGRPSMGNISLVPLDKDGIPIPDIGLDFDPATISDYDKISDLLNGNEGQTEVITFEWSYFGNKEKIDRIMKNIESFEIVSVEITNVEKFNSDDKNSSLNNMGTTNNEIETSSNYKSEEDWDEVLKSYEEYINEYVKLSKKAKAGDFTALQEYQNALEKAQDFADKLENAKGDLSPSQLSKLNRLNTKLANSMLDL